MGFKAEKSVLDMLHTHAKVHDDACDQRVALHNKLKVVGDGPLYELHQKECNFLDELFAFHRNAAKKYRERKDFRFREIRDYHELAQAALQTQMGALLDIAGAAKIDLAAAREEDEADARSLHEA